jgi:uncharacterized protein (TIGR00725 family)
MKPGINVLMKPLIAVSGSSGSSKSIPSTVLQMAEQVGYYIAEADAILLSGGRGGLMEKACKGAKSAGGLTVGILPFDKSEANKYVDIPIGTGLSYYRNMLLAHSADSIIFIAGRWGTLSEISAAVIFHTPLVFLETSSGFVDEMIKGEFFSTISSNYIVVDNPRDAVDQALLFCSEKTGQSKD